MVWSIDILVITALLSSTASSSPLALPQRGRRFGQDFGQHANQVHSVPSATESLVDVRTHVYAAGNRRITEVVTTTFTTDLYTTHTVTDSLPPAATSHASTSTSSPATTAFNSSSVPSTSSSAAAAPSSVPFESPVTTSLSISATTSTLTTTSTLAMTSTITTTSTLATTSDSATAAISATISASTTGSASSCNSAAIPPEPTNAGTVGGCTQWYVAQAGDYCYTVAQQFGISVETFMAWNPSVLPPTCTQMRAGDAYCVATCNPDSSTVPTVAPSANLSTTSSAPLIPSSTVLGTSLATSIPAAPSSTLAPLDVYRAYNGDGTPADGWPTEDQWVSYDSMFTANKPNMQASCAQWGVPLNSDDEISIMREQILSIGQETNVDPRFILAVIMQESTGCVRVITSAYSHANPGLMQSFNGTGSCNANGAPLGIPGVTGDGEVQTPCPEAEIRQQILDGTNGTVWGSGLVQDLAEQGATDVSRWYRAARLYNGGSIVEGNLALPCCTASYASDIANRLTGWVNAARVFVAQG